jgi:bifunctional UDP-N-acetylglucosamine pyrophosphorylase/glucosamine-1-phosphate N-acetyltransferase
MKKSVVAIIMAGGMGKRMGSSIPKVLHKLDGIPMINRIMLTLKNLSYTVQLEKVIVVVGKYKDQIKTSLNMLERPPNIVYVTQDEPLGTGHAIMCCQSELVKNIDSDVLILSGDVPLLSMHTMTDLLNMKSHVKLITTTLKDPTGYGRIIERDGVFNKIVEQKDCVIDQLHIARVNGGIYCITAQLLCRYLKQLNNNNSQSEYYLTDVIEIIKTNETMDVEMLEIPVEKVYEIMGVNTVDQLKELEQILKNKIEIENRLAVARINRNES